MELGLDMATIRYIDMRTWLHILIFYNTFIFNSYNICFGLFFTYGPVYEAKRVKYILILAFVEWVVATSCTYYLD